MDSPRLAAFIFFFAVLVAYCFSGKSTGGSSSAFNPATSTLIIDLTSLEQRLAAWDSWKKQPIDSLLQDRLYLHTNHYQDYHRHDFPIYLNHSDAFAFLVTEGHKGAFQYSSDYFSIQLGSDAQINQAYCGVASSAALINSLRGSGAALPQDPIYDPYPYATQTAMFNECTNTYVIQCIATFDGIASAPFGLNLQAVQALLQCHLPEDKWDVQVTHVDTSKMSLDVMRQSMKSALKDPNSRLMVNYERTSVGQVGGGHFSPIGAYSYSLDAFLLMDVAKYKYPNAWIMAETLYHSLGTTDQCASWDGPMAQTKLPPSLLHPLTMEDMKAAMRLLHCQPMPRGFMVVSKKES